MRINGTSAFSSIKLGEGQKVPNKIQVLRVGKFNHPKYGAFEITPLVLAEMKANFDANIRGIDMAFDYFHASDQNASGWVKELTLEENGTELWADVDWTPTAQRKLSEREVRYFSPDFAFKWTDPEKNTAYSNVLFGGGLTNRPFVKEMKAIVADETKGENMTDLEKALAKVAELEKANLKLSEDMQAAEKKMLANPPPPAHAPAAAGGDDVAALKKQIADLQSQLAAAKSSADVALAEKKKADDAKVAADAATCLAEKEGKFNLMLSEGKACVAQKDAYMKGDMDGFLKLAESVHTKASGSSDSFTMAEADSNAIIKLAEQKEKATPGMSRGEAISLAKKELKK